MWDCFSSLWFWPFSSPASSNHQLIRSQTSLLIYNTKVFEITNCSFSKQKAELVDQPAGTGTKLEELTSEELSQVPLLSTSYAHREISQDDWKLGQLIHISQKQKSFTSEVIFYAFVVKSLIPTASRKTQYEHTIIPSRQERKCSISERAQQNAAWCCMVERPSSSLAL